MEKAAEDRYTHTHLSESAVKQLFGIPILLSPHVNTTDTTDQQYRNYNSVSTGGGGSNAENRREEGREKEKGRER